MTSEVKKQIRQTVEHFRDSKMPVTNEVLVEYCNKNKFEPITKGKLSDYTYQIDNDAKMASMLPRILALFAEHMHYVGEYDTEKEQQAEMNSRAELKVKLVKMLEEEEIPYHWAQKLMEEFGAQVKGIFDNAGQTASMKATEVMLHIAREKFGEEIHMGHVAGYAREVFEKNAAKKEAEKSSETAESEQVEETTASDEQVKAVEESASDAETKVAEAE